MGRLKNHSAAYWLRDDAAAAFNRMEDDRGFIDLNSAGRTEAEQQNLINRWDRGGAANRPPFLYAPARPASASNHVKGGGIAFDTSEWRRVKEFAHLYGFKWYGNSDPVHFDYVGGGSSGGASFSQTVKNEQAWLNASRGEKLAVDGIKGPATTAAYKRYQEFLRAYGYTGAIDGIWGAGTQAAHAKFYEERNRPAGRPSNKNAGQLNYRDIQEALNRKGYGLAVDGIWGPKSSNALADFQAKNGLVVDRLVGPKTWDKLNTY